MDARVTGPNEDSDFRWTIEVPGPRDRSKLQTLLKAEVDTIRQSESSTADAETRVQLWLPEVDDAEDDVVAEVGFEPYRDLWQLQIDLPSRRTDLVVRAFTADDAEDFLRVNNRAFDWHPEQGGMTLDDLAARQAESWYDPAGFLLHHRDGKLAGFCWTKVHRDLDPPMGEIYAIAIDPEFQGIGLGRALTLSGLTHMADTGITRAMLYVESNNHSANAIYEVAGFRYHHTNRAYALTV